MCQPAEHLTHLSRSFRSEQWPRSWPVVVPSRRQPALMLRSITTVSKALSRQWTPSLRPNQPSGNHDAWVCSESCPLPTVPFANTRSISGTPGRSLTYGLDPGSRPAGHRKKCGSGYPLLPKDNLTPESTNPPRVTHKL